MSVRDDDSHDDRVDTEERTAVSPNAARARRLALAALALGPSTDDAPVPRPDDAELRAWMARTLSPERARAIRSLVARDPALYERWRRLREAARCGRSPPRA